MQSQRKSCSAFGKPNHFATVCRSRHSVAQHHAELYPRSIEESLYLDIRIHLCPNSMRSKMLRTLFIPKSSHPFPLPSPADDYPNLASSPTPVNRLLKKFPEVPNSIYNNLDNPQIPVRITLPRQITKSNDRRHCLQNCVEICRKTGKVINDIASKSNGIKLVHLKARSIKNREHSAQIKELVNDENVDVLAVSESWLNSSTTNAEVEISGYKI